MRPYSLPNSVRKILSRIARLHRHDLPHDTVINIISRVVTKQFHTEAAAFLFEQVIKQKPNGDERIWSAVYDLVAEPATPPREFNKALFDPPSTSITSPQKGSQQTHEDSNRRVVEGTGCCVRQDAEGKTWTDAANDTSRVASSGQLNGQQSSYRKMAC
jgi:hypothetical protein